MHVPSAPIVIALKPSPASPSGGSVILVRSSPGPTAVMYTPRKNSSAATVRSPSSPTIVIEAPAATSTGGRWFVGSLEQTFPPTVPRFRTCTSAIFATTSMSTGRVAFTSEEVMTCV
jgi:hypothetical protein